MGMMVVVVAWMVVGMMVVVVAWVPRKMMILVSLVVELILLAGSKLLVVLDPSNLEVCLMVEVDGQLGDATRGATLDGGATMVVYNLQVGMMLVIGLENVAKFRTVA